MGGTSQILIVVGVVLLLGLAANAIGRKIRIPRVTLMLLFGLGIGPLGLDLVPGSGEWFSVVASMALALVGFNLGGKLTATALREHGREVFWISVAVTVMTASLVFGGLLAVGVPLVAAMLLAGVSTATAPAATLDVVRESRRDTVFTRILLGVVALDDAWGLILFSVLLAVAQGLTNDSGSVEVLLDGAWELFGACGLGALLGLVLVFLIERTDSGPVSLLESLGAVFLCAGVALQLEVSYLLATMTMGAVVAANVRVKSLTFRATENANAPILVLFFVFAGASLRLDELREAGVVVLAYVLTRIAGRVIGGWIGGALVGAPRHTRAWTGAALLPQAGVALGMALVASERSAELGALILPVALAGTFIFELVGPVATRQAVLQEGKPTPTPTDDSVRSCGTGTKD